MWTESSPLGNASESDLRSAAKSPPLADFRNSPNEQRLRNRLTTHRGGGASLLPQRKADHPRQRSPTPAGLQGRFGAKEPFAAAEWSQPVRAGLPSSPYGALRVLAGAFRQWVVGYLEAQADDVDRMPARVAIDKVALDQRNLNNGLPLLGE